MDRMKIFSYKRRAILLRTRTRTYFQIQPKSYKYFSITCMFIYNVVMLCQNMKSYHNTLHVHVCKLQCYYYTVYLVACIEVKREMNLAFLQSHTFTVTRSAEKSQTKSTADLTCRWVLSWGANNRGGAELKSVVQRRRHPWWSGHNVHGTALATSVVIQRRRPW